MKLASPTDFDVLEALSDGKRNTAANIAIEIDRDRAYINTRLPILADQGLLERIGPAPNSGLYEITEKGKLANRHREAYHDEQTDFEALLESKLEN
ncbi:ArsR family transcriptional regulator [Natronomonas salsuginis]|jgi:predicted transcriptional regulator|uniref:ArsR family transcriptional regulator n=1 Tax=Natronomonas salsuginis TaxID=2217661 RepID=A0A4U5JHU9_9EURY|nr:ArsR family transcriptional regulator [Natronomonas salsuginis]TKR28066.1 ArsR family transcriptional regulator [Natronomonas salsuginis]